MSTTLYRDSSERIAVLPVLTATGQKQVLFSIGPISVTGKAVVDIKVQAEMTNENQYTVGIGRQLIRANSPTEATGSQVTPACMSNVTHDKHHEVLVHTGAEQVAHELAKQYYNFVVWAVSTAAKPGDKLIVEQKYGELIVEIRS